MDITPLIRRDAQVIQAYGADHIKVSGTLYHQSICITPTQTKAWDGTYTHLLALCDGCEVVLLGTGASIVPVSGDVRMLFRNQGIGLEVMDNGAVCRTYNVLLAEGRKVGAGITFGTGSV